MKFDIWLFVSFACGISCCHSVVQLTDVSFACGISCCHSVVQLTDELVKLTEERLKLQRQMLDMSRQQDESKSRIAYFEGKMDEKDRLIEEKQK